MELSWNGPPCDVCGKPSSGFIYLDNGAAPHGLMVSSSTRPSSPRCGAHNPYLTGFVVTSQDAEEEIRRLRIENASLRGFIRGVETQFTPIGLRARKFIAEVDSKKGYK